MFNSKLSSALRGNKNAAGKRNGAIAAAAGVAAGAVGARFGAGKMIAAGAKGIAARLRPSAMSKVKAEAAATKDALNKATASATKGTSKLKRKVVSQEAVEKAAANMNRVKSKAKNGGHAMKSKLADVQAKARRAGRI